MTRMRPLLQHASRAFLASRVPIAPHRASNAAFTSFATEASRRALSCRASSVGISRDAGVQLSPVSLIGALSRRQYSISKNPPESTDADKPPESSEAIHLGPPPSHTPPEDAQAPQPPVDEAPPASPTPPIEDTPLLENEPPRKPEEPVVHRVPAETLPSYIAKRRWDMSKRISEIMDELLPKLALVTQKVNTYTGTDYTSIAALKREIQEQEQLVKTRRSAIDEAKRAVEIAHAQQASSQKEVVALLERKHSWSATDLERYMNLIRSEHINDRAIREAKDAVLAAENSLEEARAKLEKRERAQYHEEQIWSDTIRRNSTWVTFGLMGLNIFLLLSSLIIFEPWRRKRMVREIKAALEEAQRPLPLPLIGPTPTLPIAAAVGAEIEKAVEPSAQPAEVKAPETVPTLSEPTPVVASATLAPEISESAPTELKELSDPASPVTESPTPPTPDLINSIAAIDIEDEAKETDVDEADVNLAIQDDATRLEKITAKLKGLKSEETISVRRKDLTATVLAATTAGWLFATIVSWIRNS